jgi:secreted Zn-dependent insulinase-like peptidase
METVGMESVVKPASDDRLYKSIVLENGLQVLLVSDTATDMAAASMSIGTGTIHDPWDAQGLAHFHEHMLFMGTGNRLHSSSCYTYVFERTNDVCIGA